VEQNMNDRTAIINALRVAYGDTVTRQQITDLVDGSNGTFQFPHWLCNDQRFRVSRGTYRLPVDAPMASSTMRTISTADNINYVPDGIEGYFAFGNHDDVHSVIESRRFYPLFITGLSGCGKTTTTMQVCHQLNRECVRVNITIETDENDLLGGMRLINGESVFGYGPVVEAMRRGAVLLLDEVDLGSNKIMCLQPVLEGRGVYLKLVNEWVHPAPGFTIVATANTKGQGSESGKFVGTNVLNEAFIDRFAATLEQDYPPEKIERKIIKSILDRHKASDDAFIDNLIAWANAIRKTYNEGAIDEIISTRRLVYIAEAYTIWRDRGKAIDLTLARFNADTREAMTSLYQKMDATIHGTTRPEKIESVTVPDDEVPF
jgi:MoxR-like ATPase